MKILAIVAATLIATISSATVPLEPAQDGHLTVPAYVNGKGPYPFILDTGADNGGVYEWFAAKAHLHPGKPEELDGQTGSVLTPTYGISTLSVAGRLIRSPIIYGLPNRHDSSQETGVVGNDLMDGAIVIFDFPCKTVEIQVKPIHQATFLTGHETLVHGGAIADGTLLTLPVRINGAEGVAMLDTGSRDSRISPQFAQAASVDASTAAFRDADLIYGANDKAKASRIGPVGTIEFAGITVPHAVARVIDLPAFATAGIGEHAMILGADLMQPYRLIYDHAAKRFWFGPSRCAPR
jgi:predicted aspartyl protease